MKINKGTLLRVVKSTLCLSLLPLVLTGSTFTLWVEIPEIVDSLHFGIPDGYYDGQCIVPHGLDMETWLTATRWRKSYKLNSWDCSGMSAFTEWVLENCGYESEIRTERIDDRTDHAYIMVKIGGKWRGYDAVTREFMPYKMTLGYEIAHSDIYSVLSSHVFNLPRFYLEYAWWMRSKNIWK